MDENGLATHSISTNTAETALDDVWPGDKDEKPMDHRIAEEDRVAVALANVMGEDENKDKLKEKKAAGICIQKVRAFDVGGCLRGLGEKVAESGVSKLFQTRSCRKRGNRRGEKIRKMANLRESAKSKGTSLHTAVVEVVPIGNYPLFMPAVCLGGIVITSLYYGCGFVSSVLLWSDDGGTPMLGEGNLTQSLLQVGAGKPLMVKRDFYFQDSRRPERLEIADGLYLSKTLAHNFLFLHERMDLFVFVNVEILIVEV